MKYLLLIYENEQSWQNIAEAEKQKIFGEYWKLTQDLKTSGKYLGGNALKPTSTATTLRFRNGKPVVTDGPFAETKEQLAGYYLIEASDLDDALKVAERIPGAYLGSIEVRPILPTP
jgi:hypothetical protein